MRHAMMSSMASEHIHSPVMEADLEDALEFAGAGKYQLLHSILMLSTLLAAILEMIGVAFVLPAAACDLDVPDNLKGIITSLPNIGIILTAPFWGRASDSLGRKPILLGSLAAAGVMAFIAAFMPSLLTFALLKFACSLFLSCPSSLGYAYVSEMLPRKRRDFAVLIINALVNLLTVFTPGLAWIILSYDWSYDFGAIDLRPWRLLTALYSLPLLLTALCMVGADESPKFLMTRGKDKEALAVVRRIYSVNTGMHEDSFCVVDMLEVDTAIIVPIVVTANGLMAKSVNQHLKRLSLGSWVKNLIQRAILLHKAQIARRYLSLEPGHPVVWTLLPMPVKSLKTPCDIKDSEQRGSGVALTPKTRSDSAFALLRPPHLKWLALTGFLMFGLFSFLNGLFLFAPDTINKVMSSEETSGTVCELIDQSDNSTSTSQCLDSISSQTFYIMVVTTVVYGVLVTGASMSPLSKKTLLVSMFIVVGVGCLFAGLSTNRIAAGVAMSSLQITALGIGPLTAYVVDLFPTTLRGTAVGAVMMFGRMGSVVGANAAGVSLGAACMVTFYAFALLVFFCAGLSFLLPPNQVTKPRDTDRERADK